MCGIHLLAAHGPLSSLKDAMMGGLGCSASPLLALMTALDHFDHRGLALLQTANLLQWRTLCELVYSLVPDHLKSARGGQIP